MYLYACGGTGLRWPGGGEFFVNVYARLLFQAAWRASCARDYFHTCKGKATLLQSVFRRVLSQKMLQRHLLAATKIEAHWRGKSCRMSYHRHRSAIIAIQAWVRSRLRYFHRTHAACCIQVTRLVNRDKLAVDITDYHKSCAGRDGGGNCVANVCACLFV